MKWLFRLIFRKKLEEVNEIIAKAQKYTSIVKKEFVKYDPIDMDSIGFLRKIHEFYSDPAIVTFIGYEKSKFDEMLINPSLPISDRGCAIGRLQAVKAIEEDLIEFSKSYLRKIEISRMATNENK